MIGTENNDDFYETLKMLMIGSEGDFSVCRIRPIGENRTETRDVEVASTSASMDMVPVVASLSSESVINKDNDNHEVAVAMSSSNPSTGDKIDKGK